MRPVISRVVVVVTLSVALASGAVEAHHSFAAMFENRTDTIRGVVVQVLFRDPHSFIQLSVRDPSGADVRYEVEWRGAADLTRQGVTRLTVKAGDFLIITGNPSRDPRDHWFRVASLRRPNDGFAWHE